VTIFVILANVPLAGFRVNTSFHSTIETRNWIEVLCMAELLRQLEGILGMGAFTS
jgi:hypothetical protein